MINEAKNLIERLNRIYKESNRDNTFIRISIKNNIFILRRIEITSILSDMIDIEYFDLKIAKDLIDSLRSRCYDNDEYELLNNLRSKMEYIYININYNAMKYKENKFYRYLSKTSMDIYHQCINFDGFCENQDRYDNMISFYKMLNRLNNINIKNAFDEIIFDSNKDNSIKYKNILLEESCKRFSIARFVL